MVDNCTLVILVTHPMHLPLRWAVDWKQIKPNGTIYTKVLNTKQIGLLIPDTKLMMWSSGDQAFGSVPLSTCLAAPHSQQIRPTGLCLYQD